MVTELVQTTGVTNDVDRVLSALDEIGVIQASIIRWLGVYHMADTISRYQRTTALDLGGTRFKENRQLQCNDKSAVVFI